MEQNLQKTIEKLQSTFTENGMNFDDNEENFWQMLNDLEIQRSYSKSYG